MAHVGAKNISPVHMRCVVTLGGRHDLGCGDGDGGAMACGWRTYGRNIFRPHIRGVGANRAGATIWGAAIVDTQVMVDGWGTDGRKMFRPYIHGAGVNLLCHHNVWCAN